MGRFFLRWPPRWTVFDQGCVVSRRAEVHFVLRRQTLQADGVRPSIVIVWRLA